MTHHRTWAVVLAGGQGRRLRSLARSITGDDRPKQFCRFFGNRSLLQDTLERVSRTAERRRTLSVVLGEHHQYYEPELQELDRRQIVEQPSDRGTAAAVAYALRRIESLSTRPGVVGFFPSDHHYANAVALQRAVAGTYQRAALHPDHVFLIGAQAVTPEVDYGWIEPGPPLIARADGARRPDDPRLVHRFWEKPSADVAQTLLLRGGLWNTFIVIGCGSAFAGMLEHAQPEFWRRFAPLGRRDLRHREAVVAREVYDHVAPVDFSRDVLQRVPEALAVIPMANAGWTDLGRPERLLHVLKCAQRPHRAGHVAAS